MAFEFDVVEKAAFNVLLKRRSRRRRISQGRLIHNTANSLLFAVGQRFNFSRQRPRRALQLHRPLQLQALHFG